MAKKWTDNSRTKQITQMYLAVEINSTAKGGLEALERYQCIFSALGFIEVNESNDVNQNTFDTEKQTCLTTFGGQL